MKKTRFIILIIIMGLSLSLIFTSCKSSGSAPASASVNISAAQTPAEPAAAQQLKDITFDDQKQVEQRITAYFGALEKKDYAAAWKLLSAEQQENYPENHAIKEHWGLDAVKLISVKGYLPPYIAEAIPPYKFQTIYAPDGIPTIWYEVELNITPAAGSAWDMGKNTRFVMVTKASDGTWRIDGLPIGP